jgi:glycosyltransferase involved in cell wall biosynthesis
MTDGRSGRLRVLVLVPFAPRFDSPHGGRATAEFLLRLARRQEVAVVCLREAGEQPTSETLGDACVLVEEVELSSSSRTAATRMRRKARLLSGLLRGVPMQPTEWRTPDYARRVAAVAKSFEPDVVHIEPLAMAQYLSNLGVTRVPRVLVVHEPAVQTARAVHAGSRGVERLLRRLDLRAWERFERAALRRVDAVVALTERDRRVLHESGSRVVQIPLGVEIPSAALDPLGKRPPRLLFVGGYGHPPNVDAALRLARGIFPRVRASHPEATLYLVGDRPPATITALAGDGVVVTGRVADVKPFLDEAAVVVAPLRLGGGMRNKVLEALAAGKAVVASRLAAAGLDAERDAQLRLAEGDAEFAEAIVELIGDDQARRELAARARSWAEEHLGWDERVDDFEALYRSLVAEGVGA